MLTKHSSIILLQMEQVFLAIKNRYIERYY